MNKISINFYLYSHRRPDRKLQRGSVSEEVEPDMAVATNRQTT